MYEIFERFILAQVALTPDDLQFIRSLSTTRKIRKRQFFLREGEIARHKIFVCQGLLRTFSRKDDGSEYTMRFAAENVARGGIIVDDDLVACAGEPCCPIPFANLAGFQKSPGAT